MTGPGDGGVPDRLLYTPEEAQAKLNIARARIFELIKTGELPSVKIGRSRRIPADDLLAYVRSLPREPPA